MLKDRIPLKLVLAALYLLLSPSAVLATCGSIVIDPGHGGSDSGAVGPSGFTEKAANLDIGLRLRDLLAKGGYHVILTRSADVSPNSPPKDLTADGRINVSDDLQARVDIANRAKAKVFVSLHNNASVASARGTETYYWSGVRADSDSARLARLIQQEVKARIGLYNRGVKSANFYVLRRTNMPAALFEGAFISNPTEEQLLKTASWRQQVAQGVFNGIRRFVGPTGPGPNEVRFKLKPNSRRTVSFNSYFCDKAVGARVTSGLPIMAERAMYFNSNGISGGSGGRGVRRPGRVWYLAEGFTGAGFDTWILLVNPRNVKTSARLKYFADGAVINGGRVKLPPQSRRSVYVNSRLPGRAFAAQVTGARPIVVERSMYFNSGGRNGGHSSAGVQKPASSWYFADGRTSDQFDTWLLLFNPGSGPASVRINYLTDGAEIAGTPVDLPPLSRRSIRVNDQLPNADMAIEVLADTNIVAERSIYFNANGASGGHSSVGAIKPAKNWYFADGSTAGGFNEFLTLQNPNAAPATVAVDYIAKGTVFRTQKVIPGRSRQEIVVGDAAEAGAGKKPGLRLGADLPVVAERSMYFSTGIYQGGSDSMGAPSLSKKWLFAEGFTGNGFSSKLILVNPNDAAAEVKIKFFKE